MATVLDRTFFNALVDDDGSGTTGSVYDKNCYKDIYDKVDAAFAGTAGLSLNGPVIFPATANPSSNVNALDDYREGSWTPVLGGSGGSSGVVYGARVGEYIKIGRQVTLSYSIPITNKGTITGSVEIQGLPFPINGSYFTAALEWYLLATTWVNLILFGVASSSVVRVRGTTVAATGNVTDLTAADLGNTSQLVGSFTYFTP